METSDTDLSTDNESSSSLESTGTDISEGTSSDIESTASDVEYTSPDVEDSSSDIEDTSSDAEDSSPDIEDSSSNVEDESPDIEDSTTDVEGSSPDIEDSSIETGNDAENTRPSCETEGSDTGEKEYDPADAVTTESAASMEQTINPQVEAYAAKCCPERETDFKNLSEKKGEISVAAIESNDTEGVILGQHNMITGGIVINEYCSNEYAGHVIAHEKMHQFSYQGHQVIESKQDTTSIDRSGIRENRITIDKETGKKTTEITGRSLNEGLTEYHTLTMEKENDIKPPFSTYNRNILYARQLDNVVGSDTMNDAYFGGKTEKLSETVNDLSNDKNAWQEFNKNLDIVCSGKKDISEIDRKTAENSLQEMLTTMSVEKSRRERIAA